MYSMERLLDNLVRRGAAFDVVFFARTYTSYLWTYMASTHTARY
jgi:hypothetical protein